MRDADTAMYHAKSRGKARHEVFDAVMHARVLDRLSLENDLRRAVANHDFEVHYQPIVALSSGMCIGFESLVRWTRGGEAISPATFVPIAEELGLIESLGTWVLHEACRTFADWQQRFPLAGLECITVNVSSRQLMQHNFLRIVEQAVEETGVRKADLRVEITETALMDQPGGRRGGAPRPARLRHQGLSRRLRHGLLFAEPSAQAARRRPENRPLVREQPAPPGSARRSSKASWRWPVPSRPASWRKVSRAASRRANWSASAARMRRATCFRGRSRRRRLKGSSSRTRRSGREASRRARRRVSSTNGSTAS